MSDKNTDSNPRVVRWEWLTPAISKKYSLEDFASAKDFDELVGNDE